MRILALVFSLIPALSLAWDNESLDSAWRQDKTAPLQQAAGTDSFTALYAHYRLAMVAIREDDKKQAKRSLDAIKDSLKDYQSCDEAALYAASLGLSITLKPWQAAFIAGRAEDAMEYCKQPPHAPSLMVSGIAQYNTPGLLGGDREEALKTFSQAIALYSEQDAWGHEDAWLWKIKALQALERDDEAVTAYEEAIALFPDYIELTEIAP